MRLFVEQLYFESECIISCGSGFYFMKSFETNEYVFLYEERCGQALEKTILDFELKEIFELIKSDDKPFEYSDILDGNLSNSCTRQRKIQLLNKIYSKKNNNGIYMFIPQDKIEACKKLISCE